MSTITEASTVEDVCQYLGQLSLNGFDFKDSIDKFSNELIDGKCFLQLDKKEILNLGIAKLSKRNALYQHISQLNGTFKPSTVNNSHSIAKRITMIENGFDTNAPEFVPSESISMSHSNTPQQRRHSHSHCHHRIHKHHSRRSELEPPKDICIRLNNETNINNDATKSENDIIDIDIETHSFITESVLEYDLQELGYGYHSANLSESMPISGANSVDTIEMEPSEVMSLPPSVVLTDITKPTQIGIDSVSNSLRNVENNDEIVYSPMNSMEFQEINDNNVTNSDHFKHSHSEVMTLELPNNEHFYHYHHHHNSNNTFSIDQSFDTTNEMTTNETTTEMTTISQELESFANHILKLKTTNAPYVMRLNVKHCKEEYKHDKSIVTFPAIFKDIVNNNDNETNAMFCLTNKTLQQLNVYYQKLNRRLNLSNGNNLNLFDENQCQQSFDIKNDSISVKFNQLKCEKNTNIFRNYYSIENITDNNNDNNKTYIIASNTVIMATYDFKNNKILNIKPIAVRGNIQTLCDDNGMTWIESDLNINGSLKYFGEKSNCIYSIENINFEDQRRDSTLMDQFGNIVKKRSIISINDNDFDWNQFEQHYLEDAISKVEFYLKVTAPTDNNNNNNNNDNNNNDQLIVEAWNIVKVEPSLRQYKRKQKKWSNSPSISLNSSPAPSVANYYSN